MTNFAKVLVELVRTSDRIIEAREHNDRRTEAYYEGKMDTLHWMIQNNIIDMKK